MPRYIGIELTNHCSGDCVLCPIGQARQGRPLGQMPYDDFCRIIDDVAAYADVVTLYKWGDPFCHPRALEMVEYVKRSGLNCRIASNLHQFDAANARLLVESRLDEFTASLHGLTEETYNLYQPAHHLEEVMTKVEAILEAKRKIGSATPRVRIAFIVRKDNERELPQLRQWADTAGLELNIIELSLNLRFLAYDVDGRPRGLSESELAKERLALMDRWLPQDPRWVNAGYKKIRELSGRLPDPAEKLVQCPAPWQGLFISWNGDVDACSGGFKPDDSLGNIYRQSIRDIWRGPLFKAARRAASGRCRCHDPRTLCRECVGTLL